MTTTTLALTPLTGRHAARIDTPLDDLLDPANHQALRDALVDHKVLVLPAANPTVEQHMALATVFGAPEPPQAQNPRHPDNEYVCVFDSDEGGGVWASGRGTTIPHALANLVVAVAEAVKEGA